MTTGNPFKIGNVVKLRSDKNPQYFPPGGVVTSIDGPWIRFNGADSGWSHIHYEPGVETTDAELAAQFRDLMGKACDVNDQLKARGFTVISETDNWRIFNITKEIKL